MAVGRGGGRAGSDVGGEQWEEEGLGVGCEAGAVLGAGPDLALGALRPPQGPQCVPQAAPGGEESSVTLSFQGLLTTGFTCW